MKYLSQLISNNLKQIIDGILETFSVIDALLSSFFPSEWSHRGFPRFFIHEALIVIIFFPSAFLFFVISTIPFISTGSMGIATFTVLSSLSFPI